MNKFNKKPMKYFNCLQTIIKFKYDSLVTVSFCLEIAYFYLFCELLKIDKHNLVNLFKKKISKISGKIFLSWNDYFCLLSNKLSKLLLLFFIDYDSLWWFGLVIFIKTFWILIFSWWKFFLVRFVCCNIVTKIQLDISNFYSLI